MFDGFDDPKENWSKLPHAMIGALPIVQTISELKVILYILRHTWGYQDFGLKRITLDEFANGRKRADGSRIDNGVGLTIPSIRDGLKRAEAHGFIIHEQDARDPARVKNFYTLKMRQGEKLLHPEGKDFSGRVKDSLPRTEKDTLERKPEKDTNGDPPADYLTDVHKFANDQNRAAVADPSEDEAAWLHYREAALNAYKELTGIHPDAQVARPAIAALASEPDFDPERWQNSIRSCVLAGVKRGNVACMIDTYRAGGDYGAMVRGDKKTNGAAHWFNDDEYERYFVHGGGHVPPHEQDPTESLWSAALSDLRGQMFPATFNTHLVNSRVERDNGTLRVFVSKSSADWLNERWLPAIVAAVRGVDPSVTSVEVGT
jgi:hypothetical protein